MVKSLAMMNLDELHALGLVIRRELCDQLEAIDEALSPPRGKAKWGGRVPSRSCVESLRRLNRLWGQEVAVRRGRS